MQGRNWERKSIIIPKEGLDFNALANGKRLERSTVGIVAKFALCLIKQSWVLEATHPVDSQALYETGMRAPGKYRFFLRQTLREEYQVLASDRIYPTV